MTASSLRPIAEVARDLGIADEHLIAYGTDKAKVRLEARRAALDGGRGPGKLVLVTAVTPTDAGEGKTVTSIGLSQGLNHIGESVALALREPSLGPIFGMKGGAIGGGLSCVEPRHDINMHFNGDFHAISTANNLLAAALDNHMQQGNTLDLDPRRVLWRRVVDLNDRALRQVIIGLGGPTQGVPRETGFDITPASEIMAILCLSKDRADLRERLGRILIGLTSKRQPVTAKDLGVVGALMVILKDALLPNLVQTSEGVPAFIHGGPFANIAHGCNSLIATRMGLALADWTVTEAGFGADLGAEKFLDIKCRMGELDPAAVVVVATVKALKRHGGVPQKRLAEPDAGAVERGLDNLRKHVENVRHFGRDPVVAINHFAADTDEELAVISKACADLGVAWALSDVFGDGGAGGAALARKVVEQAAKVDGPYTPLYSLEQSAEEKVEALATKLYGADGVVWSDDAKRDLRRIAKLGYANLPVCVAKTHKSLSDDPKKANRPSGFTVQVRRLVLSAGAGFLVPLLGEVVRMPGLPKRPNFSDVELLDSGEIVGLG
ncbi:MAG: formate--tetrahydrofolate ligase [Acidobacteriota bacterium]